MFTHPVTGESMPVKQAVEQEFLVGSLTDVEEAIKTARLRSSNLLVYTTRATEVRQQANRRI